MENTLIASVDLPCVFANQVSKDLDVNPFYVTKLAAGLMDGAQVVFWEGICLCQRPRVCVSLAGLGQRVTSTRAKGEIVRGMEFALHSAKLSGAVTVDLPVGEVNVKCLARTCARAAFPMAAIQIPTWEAGAVLVAVADTHRRLKPDGASTKPPMTRILRPAIGLPIAKFRVF